MNEDKIIEWLKSRISKLTSTGKMIGLVGILLCALALCVFTACGTIGWASSRDSASTQVTITTTPNVQNSADISVTPKE